MADWTKNEAVEALKIDIAVPEFVKTVEQAERDFDALKDAGVGMTVAWNRVETAERQYKGVKDDARVKSGEFPQVATAFDRLEKLKERMRGHNE